MAVTFSLREEKQTMILKEQTLNSREWKGKIYLLKFALNKLEKREKSGSKTEYSNELEVAGFWTGNREGFQILFSSVLLRNER
jgi:hypothetical protein